uniref:C-type lectin domain-containing protein n=1 Tax=Oryzias melastigma TaxID=30732 RepID=A0A3B3D7Z6_ORYME
MKVIQILFFLLMLMLPLAFRPSKFIFVSTLMTWDDAKNHCRSLYTDLARVNNETENTEIYALLPRNAWIGLYRRPWSPWSDHTPTNFANWDASQLGGLDPTPLSCGAVNTTTGLWFNVNCEEKHNFICQNLIPPRSRVNDFRVTFKLFV